MPENKNNLIRLDLWNNQITDLSIFANLKKLQELRLGKNVLWNTSNFLENLKNCQSLKELRVENTGVYIGLEYLPKELKMIYCTGKLEKILRDYKTKEGYYDYQAWRRDNKDLVNTKTLEIEREKLEHAISNLEKQSNSKLSKENEMIAKEVSEKQDRNDCIFWKQLKKH